MPNALPGSPAPGRAPTYYNLLESFQYGLADDDFKAKWEALGWPKRMAGIVEVVAASLEADATRFQEVMVVEEEQFRAGPDRGGGGGRADVWVGGTLMFAPTHTHTPSRGFF